MTSIRGRSGSGKSTLLHLIAGFDTATEGKVIWNGKELERKELTEYRRKEAGINYDKNAPAEESIPV